MLDVSARAGVLNLMRDLRGALGLTALYISHDLTLVRYVCERTLVMYLGKIVEDGPTDAVISRPAHPYTQALIQAVPRPQPDQSHAELPIRGGLGNSASPPSGCRLRDRCPHAFDRCQAESPGPGRGLRWAQGSLSPARLTVQGGSGISLRRERPVQKILAREDMETQI